MVSNSLQISLDWVPFQYTMTSATRRAARRPWAGSPRARARLASPRRRAVTRALARCRLYRPRGCGRVWAAQLVRSQGVAATSGAGRAAAEARPRASSAVPPPGSRSLRCPAAATVSLQPWSPGPHSFSCVRVSRQLIFVLKPHSSDGTWTTIFQLRLHRT